MTPMPTQTPDELLTMELARYYADPLGFVMMAYPWKQTGTELEHEKGPDENQKQFLIDLGKEVTERAFNGTDPVMPILMTETSGHGTGKSVMGAWIADWILSTRPDSIGTVTAGTFTQLESRTWAAIQHWTKLCITGHWFHIQARGVYHKLRPKTWKIVAQTCKEENAQAFAGQHARTSTSWYLFDEASLIPDKVWTVAQGGLTDGQPMFFAWGQCERNTGRFYEINFGSKEHRWNHRTVDSRQSRFTNKAPARARPDRVRRRLGLRSGAHPRAAARRQRTAVHRSGQDSGRAGTAGRHLRRRSADCGLRRFGRRICLERGAIPARHGRPVDSPDPDSRRADA